MSAEGGLARWTRWFGRGSTDAPAERWIVFDAETSGLDATQHRLLSIAAIAIVGREIHVQDSFEGLIRQATPSSHENIVIHGIGGTAQRSGLPEEEVLRGFEVWRAGAPILGWHIGFDIGFLKPAYQRCKLAAPTRDVLDLAPLAQALFRDSTQELDRWLTRFGIPVQARHSAGADAWMTALLAARLAAEARNQGATGFKSLKSLASSLRWTGA